jgi:hypothetical protein
MLNLNSNSKFIRTKVPDDVWDILVQSLNKWEFLIPGWCAEVKVIFGSEGMDDCLAQVEIRYAQRDSILIIGAKWLDTSIRERELTIAHEMIHILNAPLTEFIENLLENIVGEDHLAHKFLDQLFHDRWEAVTEDISRAIAEERGLP